MPELSLYTEELVSVSAWDLEDLPWEAVLKGLEPAVSVSLSSYFCRSRTIFSEKDYQVYGYMDLLLIQILFAL